MRLSRVIAGMVIAAALIGGRVSPAVADMGVGERTVGASGSSLWELNRDMAGALYVSDYALPAVLAVNPATGAYTRYTFDIRDKTYVIMPSDAKPDAAGQIWWSDYYAAFGRTNPTTGGTTYWDLTGTFLAPAGFAFDPAGRVWLTQEFNPQLLRFDPSAGQLCRFNVGGGGRYMIAHGGVLWIGDAQARRLLRFDPQTNQLRWWALPDAGASPRGLAFDAAGRLWWADAVPGTGKLGRLAPENNQAVTYLLPSGTEPVMVAPGGEVVWYTDRAGTAGFLDPARASGAPTTLTTGTATLSPIACATVASRTQTPARTTGTFTFSTVNWASLAGTPVGITAFIPPTTTTTPSPYGMAASDGRTWLADQSRLTLARTPRAPRPPTVSISLAAGAVTLSWGAVTQDEGGGSVTVSNYQVWRGGQPGFRPWDPGVTLVGTPPVTSFPAGPAPAAGQAAFFGVRSVASSGLLSQTSSRVGVFSFALTPGDTP